MDAYLLVGFLVLVGVFTLSNVLSILIALVIKPKNEVKAQTNFPFPRKSNP